MTEGGSRNDESVTFSLRELLKQEDERVERERRAEEEARAAAAKARLDAERRAQEEAERAAAEAREAARRTELEELARREALQRAAMEQARLEVEVRARADERERERRHEIELARVRAATQKDGFGLGALAASAAFGLALAGLTAFGVHLAVTAPAADRRVAEVERALTTEHAKTVSLEAELDREKKRRAELDGRVADLGAQLEAAAKKPCTTAVGASKGPQRPTTSSKRPEPTSGPCQPGDPMCFAIPR